MLPLLPLADASLSPIVIVPGDGSNQIEAKLNKPSSLHWYCSKTSDWFRLWLSTSQLLAATDCWADNIKLIYDEERDTFSNNAGVETRVPDFGGTSSFEELDPSIPAHKTAAFYNMVKGLVTAGHVRNKTLRGAPYDFRYAPSSPIGAKYIADLKALIEETSTTQGKRVNLVSHSMGCLQVHYLLTQQSQAWKDKYIEKWFPISGPFGGTAKELRLHASGDAVGLPVNPLTIREEQRSYETNLWMAPVPKWWGDTSLVFTPSRNYTAHDYNAFFTAIGYPAGAKIYKRIEDLTSEVQAPGVDVVCMYSLGVDTPYQFRYGADGFDKQPETINGDGDGTVNDLSLKLCERWASDATQTRSTKVLKFSNITHSDMIMKDEVLQVLYKELGLPTHQEVYITMFA